MAAVSAQARAQLAAFALQFDGMVQPEWGAHYVEMPALLAAADDLVDAIGTAHRRFMTLLTLLP